MKNLPATENPVLLRTDFADDTAWEKLCAKVLTPSPGDGFLPELQFTSDPEYQGASIDALVGAAQDHPHSILFVADHLAMTESDNAILCIDLVEEPGRSFRVIPSEMWGVENNLSLANMDYVEFYESTDPDGVFRGFD